MVNFEGKQLKNLEGNDGILVIIVDIIPLFQFSFSNVTRSQ